MQYPQKPDKDSGWKDTVDLLCKILIPLIIAFCGWQFSLISTLDSRIYTLQKEAVTQESVRSLETRLMSYMDTRLSDMSGKLDQSNKNMETIIYMLRESTVKGDSGNR